MKLYDTSAQALVEVSSRDNQTMYVCGITPYDSAHMGHAFTFLTYDLIARRCRDSGKTMRVVRNITDVDEPLYEKARACGLPYLELAEMESQRFNEAMTALNLEDVDVAPRASQHIAQMAEAVADLLKKGFAYRLGVDIYFDVTQARKFGAVSNYPGDLMRRFMAMRGGDPGRSGKRSPLDFLLWHGVADSTDPAAWETCVGYGRPGWHIECTVMAREHLGSVVDIHGGGADLIFPHHECESAQSVAAEGEDIVRHWVHTAPILMGGEKMSKSLGNLVFADELLSWAEPAAVRLALLNYHYRSGGEWRPELVGSSAKMLDRLRVACTRPAGADPRPYLARMRAALDEDLNAPEALRALDELASSLLVGGPDESAATGLNDAMGLLGVAA